MEVTRGSITKVFGGRERTFKFGLKSAAIFSEFLEKEKVETALHELPYTFLAGLLAHGAKENDVTEEIDIETFYDWILELGEEEADEIYAIAEHAMGFQLRMRQIIEERKARKSGEAKKGKKA